MNSLPSRAYASSYSLSLASRLTPINRILRAAETGDWRSALEALSDRPIVAHISQSREPEVAVDEFVSDELREASRAIRSVAGQVPALHFAEAYTDFVNLSSLMNGSRSYLAFGILENDVLAGELVGKGREDAARILRLHGFTELANALESENPKYSLMEITLKKMGKWAKGTRLSRVLRIIVDHWNFALLAAGGKDIFPGGNVSPEAVASGGGPRVIAELGYPLLSRAMERPEFSALIMDISLASSVWHALSGDPVVGDVFVGAFFSLLAERSIYRHLYFSTAIYRRAGEIVEVLRGLP